MSVDKSQILDALVARLTGDLDALAESQRETQAGATHAEARPESDKDTRATESSYLARGLAKRVEELTEAVAQLSTLKLRVFSEGGPVALSAVVAVERESGDVARYFVVPSGGGVKLRVGEIDIVSLSPSAPLGRALMGRSTDDDVEVHTPEGPGWLTVVEVI